MANGGDGGCRSNSRLSDGMDGGPQQQHREGRRKLLLKEIKTSGRLCWKFPGDFPADVW